MIQYAVSASCLLYVHTGTPLMTCAISHVLSCRVMSSEDRYFISTDEVYVHTGTPLMTYASSLPCLGVFRPLPHIPK